MFTEKFLEVIGKEGVVSIVSHDENEAHVVNTWNSYLVTKDNLVIQLTPPVGCPVWLSLPPTMHL